MKRASENPTLFNPPPLFTSCNNRIRLTGVSICSKDVRLPIQLQRAMAAEAEASREARAKVIAAEGEQKASRALREASEVIGDSPAALQLRYLQVNAAERNNPLWQFPRSVARDF